MSDIAVRVEGLGKEYRIGKVRENTRSLQETLMETVAGPIRRAGNLLRGQASGAADLEEEIWALKDVSFEIKRGEVVGFIGKNGAGKSTLLKILSRITEPTTGFADIYGRVSSLLEVGTGFHQELTGRENIFLNGAILGMSRRDINKNFEAIVEFSEIGRFIDTPIKHYSSGMTLRLAFAVAAHLEPEIMIVDEVLAVGDAAFQQKCIGKMGEVAETGRTVLFVSHNMGAVTQLCNRGIWLKDGQLKLDASATEAVTSYLLSGTQSHGSWKNDIKASEDAIVQLKTAAILTIDKQSTGSVEFSTPFNVEVGYEIYKPIKNMAIVVQLSDSMGNVILETTDHDSTDLKGKTREPGKYTSACEVPANILKPGRYFVTIRSFTHAIKMYDSKDNVLTFDITYEGYDMHHPRQGIITPVFKWNLNSGYDSGQ